jgi:predicted nucleotidyltransferase
MRLKNEEIIELVRQNLSARQEIVFAYVFGSIVESDAFKDVDVGVYVDASVSDSFRYAFGLSLALERLLGYRVDVIVMNTAPDRMIYHVSRGKLILNRDDDTRADFICAAWKRYWDYAFLRDRYLNDVAEEVSRP